MQHVKCLFSNYRLIKSQLSITIHLQVQHWGPNTPLFDKNLRLHFFLIVCNMPLAMPKIIQLLLLLFSLKRCVCFLSLFIFHILHFTWKKKKKTIIAWCVCDAVKWMFSLFFGGTSFLFHSRSNHKHLDGLHFFFLKTEIDF